MLYALAGFALLSCGDAVVKSTAGAWAPTAIAALRYVIGAVGLGVLLALREGRRAFVLPHPAVQLLRGAAVALSTVAFFSSIFVMPLAAATALTFTQPMFTALLAALFLGEPARRQTWIASVVAFAGVLIVLRPNLAEAGWAAVLPLISAFGMSALMIGNRRVAGAASPLAMQFAVAAIAAPLLVLAAWLGTFTAIPALSFGMPDWTVVARAAIVACTASTAHWLVFLATTRAGAATIAPMTYVQLIIATAIGWAFFANAPDLLTLLGGAIIIAAGLYLWHSGRERRPDADEPGATARPL